MHTFAMKYLMCIAVNLKKTYMLSHWRVFLYTTNIVLPQELHVFIDIVD
jgi:hypothetical protein